MNINPYSGVGSPADGDRFVGRVDILQRIEQDLLSQAQVSLAGLGRIGKTSLSRRILSKIASERPDITTGRIQINEFRKEVILWEEILNVFFQDDVNLPNDSDDAYRQFRRILRSKRKEKFRGILLLDEFDSVIKYDNQKVIIDRLREIACDREIYGITFLFVSRRSLARIQNECEGSNLFGICQKYYLRSFDKTDTRSLLDQSKIPYDDPFFDQVFEYTGGYPFLLECFMKEFFSLYHNSVQPDISVLAEKAFSSIGNCFVDLFDEIHKFLLHDNVWDGLCSEFITPKVRQVDPDTIQILTDYGLISEFTNSSCLSDVFCSYLQKKHCYLSTWEPLSNFEQALRLVVKSGLEEIYGPQWVTDAPKRKPYYEKIFPQLNALLVKEQAIFKRGGDVDLLEFSYPGTLKDIIITEWDFFCDIFKGNKTLFKQSMDAICLVRNPLAHARRAELIPASNLWAAQKAIDDLNVFLDKPHD